MNFEHFDGDLAADNLSDWQWMWLGAYHQSIGPCCPGSLKNICEATACVLRQWNNLTRQVHDCELWQSRISSEPEVLCTFSIYDGMHGIGIFIEGGLVGAY